MKFFDNARARQICFTLLLIICPATAARAQDSRLQITNLDKYEASAVETVEVTLDGSLLQLAAKFLSDKDPEERKVKELIKGLRGIYVRVFEFDKDGVYQPADLEAVRAQLRTSNWSKIVGIRSKREREDVDVYISTAGSVVQGMAVIAAGPRELTVVNIVGPIDLDKLRDLEGSFGIPKFGLWREHKTGKE